MYAITLHVRDDSDAPIPGSYIRVFSLDGETAHGEGEVDEDGNLTLDVPGGEYWVRAYSRGYRFEPRMRIEVSGDTTYRLEGTDVATHPSSTDPLLCRITGSVVGVNGLPLTGVLLHVSGSDLFGVVATSPVLGSSYVARPSPSGAYDFQLPRGAVAHITVAGDDRPFRCKVPNRTYCPLGDLLTPYVSSIVAETETLTLDVGEVAEIPVTATLSSSVGTPFLWEEGGIATIRDYVAVTSSDSSVAAAYVEASGIVRVIARRAGAATLTLTELAGSCLARTPTPTRTLSVIEVTVDP